jgi:hypothetical protein
MRRTRLLLLPRLSLLIDNILSDEDGWLQSASSEEPAGNGKAEAQVQLLTLSIIRWFVFHA